MEQKNLCFNKLCELVLAQLKDNGYMDSTLTIYRRFYNRVQVFINNQGSDVYTSEVGQKFLSGLHVSTLTMSTYVCAIRRLDDFVNGTPYRCHHGNPSVSVPEIYADTLNKYLEECKNVGNKQFTIDAKKKSCVEFLNYIECAGCLKLSELDINLISQALLIFDNKDNYARIRMFLKYLADERIIPSDFSGVVPHYKRRKVLPTTYSPDEIRKLEDSINTGTATGKSNLAIIRLATRMGFRAGDIARLKWSEVDFNTGYISIIQQKTGQPLSLQMPDDVALSLISYLENINTQFPDGYVFHSMYAPYGPITTSIIRHAVTACFNAAGINTYGKKHGPHAFRSSLASSMINNGGDYETVRRILGHTDPNVIKHYARIDIAQLRLCAITPPKPTGTFADYLSGKKVITYV